jgi:eukaryotic-like serine/threonine-protein kinase
MSDPHDNSTLPPTTLERAHTGPYQSAAEAAPAEAGRYRTGATLYADAFDAEPKLAVNLSSGNRFRAACCAALAAAGKGEDARKLDDRERDRLRRQALRWLRADLTLWAELLAESPEQTRPFAGPALKGWKKNAELASIRDKEALAELSSSERAPFVKLWADVDALLAKLAKDE